MRKLELAMLGSIVSIAVSMAWLPSAAAQSSSVPAASASSPSEGEAPGGANLVVVQEDVLVPLIGEPEQFFRRARRDFNSGRRRAAAREIRAAGALIELEAGRHDAQNKSGLDQSANQLKQLAAGVQNGSVKSVNQLDRAFAQADLALARHYHDMAANYQGSDHGKVGRWLQAAANSVSGAAAWSKQKLSAGGKSTVSEARKLGNQVESGTGWAADKVGKSLSDLGQEITHLSGASGTSSASSN
ncbi:MAG TPA: hypothetical protein VKV28_16560 [Candidatus Binataceae bacterium]|nr:hypothetical protein [Candidatus Binataceae bacterium]